MTSCWSSTVVEKQYVEPGSLFSRPVKSCVGHLSFLDEIVFMFVFPGWMGMGHVPMLRSCCFCHWQGFFVQFLSCNLHVSLQHHKSHHWIWLESLLIESLHSVFCVSLKSVFLHHPTHASNQSKMEEGDDPEEAQSARWSDESNCVAWTRYLLGTHSVFDCRLTHVPGCQKPSCGTVSDLVSPAPPFATTSGASGTTAIASMCETCNLHDGKPYPSRANHPHPELEPHSQGHQHL